MEIVKNIVLKKGGIKPILVDFFYKKRSKKMPIVIFCHGYKGFKDWGAWNLVGKAFANKNFFFIKFNFSHNGGTVENPIDFPDLESFGNNNLKSAAFRHTTSLAPSETTLAQALFFCFLLLYVSTHFSNFICRLLFFRH